MESMRLVRTLAAVLVAILACACAQGASIDGAGGVSPDGGAAGADASLDADVATGDAPDEASDGAGDAPDDSANPCANVACNTPPASACVDASTLRVYNATGSCSAGQCTYSSTTTSCACANGACTSNPCLGVTCAAPPQNYCANATNLAVYDIPGSCSGGTCSYTTHNQYCQFGCAGKVCNGDPCSGVSCTTPSASYCSDATHLTVYDTPGACSTGLCSYPSHVAFCQFGCVNGQCANDPCAGVSCSTPPASYCSGATTLHVSSPSGTCSNGACSYTGSDQSCQYGCSNGVCLNCSTQSDCGAGKWCNSGSCATCSSDQHCGASCTDCTATSSVCSAATSCAQCTTDSQCGSGRWCNGGTCAVCKTDASCGASCSACSGATPRCLDQGSTSKCVQCLSAADCTGGGACTGNACVSSGCSPPAESCQSGNQSRSGCANALVIGRLEASVSAGYFTSTNTCSASDASEGPNSGSCWDYGRDHSYRIFLRAGESIAVTLTQGSKCSPATSWDRVFKIYSGNGCSDKSCSNGLFCASTGSGTYSKSYTAPADAWYVIVVDGRTATNVYDDSGSYTLTVKLTCLAGTCNC